LQKKGSVEKVLEYMSTAELICESMRELKVNVVPVLTHNTIKKYGTGGIAPRILNLGTGWR
jgi:hypothetical protein